MSAPDPISRKQAVGRLAGPRYHPAAHDVLALADAAVKAHQGIGEEISAHVETTAQEQAARRADSHAAAPDQAGAP